MLLPGLQKQTYVNPNPKERSHNYLGPSLVNLQADLKGCSIQQTAGRDSRQPIILNPQCSAPLKNVSLTRIIRKQRSCTGISTLQRR
jgi:hypothetical protein